MSVSYSTLTTATPHSNTALHHEIPPQNMKFVALVSGGKDSIYSILESQRHGHVLIACVHLGKPSNVEEESFMYQTAASEALKVLVEDCLGVPLVLYERRGTSVNTSLVYHETEHDEVEDLYQALRQAKQRYPDVEALSSGAILSTYQRTRVESVCGRLNLTSLSYLWRYGTQHQLLDRMLNDGIEAVLVRTASPPGLMPRRHLNKTLRQLQTHFHALYDRYQFHVCGEGGEYETLVLDCPIFQKRLVLDKVEIQDTDDGVGVLHILECHAEHKDSSVAPFDGSASGMSAPNKAAKVVTQSPPRKSESSQTSRVSYLPRVRRVEGGLWHVSEIVSSIVVHEGASEVELAVAEASQVFARLDALLRRNNCTPQDVMMVHLYLSEISHFAAINLHYREFFGVMLPPSRSCVGLGKGVLPGGRRVLLDCIVQAGSGEYMRTMPTNDCTSPYTKAAHATVSASLRHVLHVQSISHWAPVCVGPYSQVNTYRDCVHFVAGHIGLKPASMTLRDTWREQLHQAWTNVASVLDALNGCSLEHLMSGLVYIATHILSDGDVIAEVQKVCSEQSSRNGGIEPGAIDGLSFGKGLHDGYEDEGTMLELASGSCDTDRANLPFLVVAIPEMPVGAVVELEVIAATKIAKESLDLRSPSFVVRCATDTADELRGWETGHDFLSEREDSAVAIHTYFRALGPGCAACALVTARFEEVDMRREIDCFALFRDMIRTLAARDKSMYDLPRPSACLHLRLYYCSNGEDDGTHVRHCLSAASSSVLPDAPATTTVPVDDMYVLEGDDVQGGKVIFALQAFFFDAIRAETDLWIHRGRGR